jgi:hypothetical protein
MTPQPASLLLIAPEEAARPILAAALAQRLDLSVTVVPSHRAAMAQLRQAEYALIVTEESLAAANPEATDLLYSNATATPVLEINFALTSAARVARQVRAALVRRAQDRARAERAAAAQLQGELNAALTGLLLESELALRSATSEQQPRLRHLVALAAGLRNRLRT